MHRLLLLAALFTRVSAGPNPVGSLDDPMRDGGSRALLRPPYMPLGPDVAPLKKPKVFARKADQLRGWFTQIPGGARVPTPTIHRGQVLISGGSASHEFYSLALVTGFSLWQYRTQDNAPSAAAADGDHVAFTTESCEVEVLSTEGKPLWKRWLGSEMLSMPSISGGLLYVGYPAEKRSQISAFAIGSGEEVWSMPLASELLSAPVIKDGKVIVTVADGTVQCLEGKNGETLWRSPMKATAAPIVAGGFAFMPVRAPGGPEMLMRRALGPDETSLTFSAVQVPAPHLSVPSFGYPGGPLDKPIEQAKKQAFDHIGLIGSFDMWSHTGSRPVHHAGTIYTAMDKAIFAVDAATGTVKWKKGQDLAENQFYRGSFYTSPAYANGKLFVGTADGHLVCFDAGSGERRWSFRVGQQIESPPVVCDGRVVVTTVNGRVACVETGDPADTGWPTWGGNAARTGDTADAKITSD